MENVTGREPEMVVRGVVRGGDQPDRGWGGGPALSMSELRRS